MPGQEPDDGAHGLPTAMGDAFEALSELFGLMHARLQQTIRPFELLPPYALALARIDGAVPMKELGLKLGCDPSFVTAIADVLEERGLVRREVDRADRRSKNLVLTPEGVAVRSALQREFFDDLPGIRELDDHERRDFVVLLRKMIAAETDRRHAS
jgi:MarR family transcriptional regulator, organic hydroperoxide resistance regulator